jgi:hypothetical protein
MDKLIVFKFTLINNKQFDSSIIKENIGSIIKSSIIPAIKIYFLQGPYWDFSSLRSLDLALKNLKGEYTKKMPFSPFLE